MTTTNKKLGRLKQLLMSTETEVAVLSMKLRQVEKEWRAIARTMLKADLKRFWEKEIDKPLREIYQAEHKNRRKVTTDGYPRNYVGLCMDKRKANFLTFAKDASPTKRNGGLNNYNPSPDIDAEINSPSRPGAIVCRLKVNGELNIDNEFGIKNAVKSLRSQIPRDILDPIWEMAGIYAK